MSFAAAFSSKKDENVLHADVQSESHVVTNPWLPCRTAPCTVAKIATEAVVPQPRQRPRPKLWTSPLSFLQLKLEAGADEYSPKFPPRSGTDHFPGCLGLGCAGQPLTKRSACPRVSTTH